MYKKGVSDFRTTGVSVTPRRTFCVHEALQEVRRVEALERVLQTAACATATGRVQGLSVSRHQKSGTSEPRACNRRCQAMAAENKDRVHAYRTQRPPSRSRRPRRSPPTHVRHRRSTDFDDALRHRAAGARSVRAARGSRARRSRPRDRQGPRRALLQLQRRARPVPRRSSTLLEHAVAYLDVRSADRCDDWSSCDARRASERARGLRRSARIGSPA